MHATSRRLFLILSCSRSTPDVHPGWLNIQNEDRENPIARVVEQALIHGRRNGSRGCNSSTSVGAVAAYARRAQSAGLYSPRSSAANLSAMYAPAASSAQAQRRRSSASPDMRRYTASDIRGAAFASSPSLKSAAAINRASISESMSDFFFDMREEICASIDALSADFA